MVMFKGLKWFSEIGWACTIGKLSMSIRMSFMNVVLDHIVNFIILDGISMEGQAVIFTFMGSSSMNGIDTTPGMSVLCVSMADMHASPFLAMSLVSTFTIMSIMT